LLVLRSGNFNLLNIDNWIGKSNNGDANPNAIYDEIKIYEGAMSSIAILNNYFNEGNEKFLF
jgi:hypothetical protein